MGGCRATESGNFAFMLNCCETRKSREFCGCDAWLDGWAHGVVVDGKNFCVVSNCCADGVLAPWHGRWHSVANCWAGLTGWPMVPMVRVPNHKLKLANVANSCSIDQPC
jgi:hypothetical protein